MLVRMTTVVMGRHLVSRMWNIGARTKIAIWLQRTCWELSITRPCYPASLLIPLGRDSFGVHKDLLGLPVGIVLSAMLQSLHR